MIFNSHDLDDENVGATHTTVSQLCGDHQQASTKEQNLKYVNLIKSRHNNPKKKKLKSGHNKIGPKFVNLI